jgi:hypothetical protein
MGSFSRGFALMGFALVIMLAVSTPMQAAPTPLRRGVVNNIRPTSPTRFSPFVNTNSLMRVQQQQGVVNAQRTANVNAAMKNNGILPAANRQLLGTDVRNLRIDEQAINPNIRINNGAFGNFANVNTNSLMRVQQQQGVVNAQRTANVNAAAQNNGIVPAADRQLLQNDVRNLRIDEQALNPDRNFDSRVFDRGRGDFDRDNFFFGGYFPFYRYPGYFTPYYGSYVTPALATPGYGGGYSIPSYGGGYGGGYGSPSYGGGYSGSPSYSSGYPYPGYEVSGIGSNANAYGNPTVAAATNANPATASTAPSSLTSKETGKVLTAIGVPNDGGQLSYPLGLQVLQPQTENLQLLDRIETLFQVMANQEIRGEVSANLAAETRGALDRLQTMLKARQTNMMPDTYSQAQQYLDKLRHGLQLVQAKAAP